MKRQILAGTMAIALATGMTTSAMAFSRGGHVGGLGGHVHAGVIHGGGFAANRMAGVRGYSAMRNGGWSGRHFGGGYGYGGYPYDAYAAGIGVVGLGLGLAEAATGYYDPYVYDYGYTAPVYDYGYAGPAYDGYGAPIHAWSY